MSLLLDGFGVGGYRSLGKPQRIGPLKKLSVLVGENNSGKSNVLRFLSTYLSTLSTGNFNLNQQAVSYNSDLDSHRSAISAYPYAAFAVSKHSERVARFVAKLDGNVGLQSFLRDVIDALAEEDDMIWIPLQAARDAIGPYEFRFPSYERFEGLMDVEARWESLRNALSNIRGGTLHDSWVHQVIRAFYSRILPEFQSQLIPAFRRIVGTEMSLPHTSSGALLHDENNAGRGLVKRLAEIQNPNYENRSRRVEYENLLKFIRELLGNESVEISIPHDRSAVLVKIDGEVRPLESFGTGLHQLIILAAYCTVYSNTVIALEEPELYLHPNLQRKLFQYLNDKTSNQYVISSHSPYAINSPYSAVFGVRLEDGRTIIDPIKTDGARADLCNDLGLRPSDLVQTNCIIWVEGPSDRIYLLGWLQKAAPNLKDGVHFSVMPYGGCGQLKYLCGSDESGTDALISLTRLNRHSALIADSDKKQESDPLSKHVKRLAQEIVAGNGFAWVTQGRELENYPQPSNLEAAAKMLRHTFVRMADATQYGDCEKVIIANTVGAEIQVDLDKVPLAHTVVSLGIDPGRFDCPEKLAQLITFIRKSNGIAN